MRNQLLVALAILANFGMGTSVAGASESSVVGILQAQVDTPQSIQSVKPQPDKILKSEVRGELLKIDGDIYSVKETDGKEVRLQIDKDTRLDPQLKPGDRVEAKVMPQGYIWSLKKMEGSDSTGSLR